MSERTHTHRAEAVEAEMREVVTTMDYAGLVWAVASGPADDRHLTLRAPGTAPADALIRISSVTKLVATAATLGLAEDGVLPLQDPLERWVPEWAGRTVLRARHARLTDTVPATRPTTVRDLLTMGFGLGLDVTAPDDDELTRAADVAGVVSDWRPPGLEPAMWADRVAGLPLAHQPGEGWLYQSSFDALTVVVEAATGRPFDEVLRDRVLTPLGMAETGYTVEAAQLPRVPAHGFPDDSGRVIETYPDADRSLLERPAFCSAATGLVSTADDLVAFAQMLLDDGCGPRGRVLSEAAVRAMATDTLAGPARQPAREMANEFLEPGIGWGLGAGLDAEGRFGWDGGTGASLWIDRDARVAGVLLTSQAMGSPDPPECMRRFWRAVREEPWT